MADAPSTPSTNAPPSAPVAALALNSPTDAPRKKRGRPPKGDKVKTGPSDMRQGYRGFDAGTIPTNGPFRITFRLEDGHQWYNKGWFEGSKPPQDWTAYLAERFGTGFFTVWSMRKDREFGRFLVTEADVARAQALAAPATPTTPAANPPPAVYPDDTRRKLRRYKRRIIELEQALAELEEQQDDDAAPNPGPQTIAEQLDQARRDAEAAKAYNAAINPPPPPAFDLAKLVQSLAPIVAPLVQQQLAKQQEAQKPPAMAPPVPPEWMQLVAELQRRGADPGALLQNMQTQEGGA
jgi:hypothetical protein